MLHLQFNILTILYYFDKNYLLFQFIYKLMNKYIVQMYVCTLGIYIFAIFAIFAISKFTAITLSIVKILLEFLY